jgi:hypothetical protein
MATPGFMAANRWHRVWAGAAVMLLAALLLVAVDGLASFVGPVVADDGPGPLAQPRLSTWTAAAGNGVSLLSKDLTISIDGDELTATYTVTAPAGSALGMAAETDDGSNAGNDLVDNILGDVTVAEFRYGFTGSQYMPAYLSFEPPTLTISTAPASHKRLIDTVTVQSFPFRLYRQRQEVAVQSPEFTYEQPPLIDVTAPDAQVSTPVNAAVQNDGNGSAQLAPAKDYANNSAITFTLSEEGAGQSWLDGLRGVGGITIPFADNLLNRLNSLFVYIVLLLSLRAAKRRLADRGTDDGGIIDAAHKAVRAIVIALAAVAAIGFAFDVSPNLHPFPTPANAAIATGPLALLVGGAVLVWPLACWRWSRGKPRAAAGRISPRGTTTTQFLRFLPSLLQLTVTALYWLFLVSRGLNPLGHAGVIVDMTVILLAVDPIVRYLCGGNGPLTVLVSTGLIVACYLGAAVPALLWLGWEPSPTPDVSSVGKWAYLVAAIATAAGLCMLCGRTTWAIFHRYQERVSARLKNRSGTVIDRLDRRLRIMSWTAVAGLCTVIIAAIVPDAVSESAVADPAANGLIARDLFQLFDALPQLVDWLALFFAILVVMLLPTTPDARPAARNIAVPIAMLLFYWNDTWLYVPVTMTVGFFLIRWLLLPDQLAYIPRATRNPGSAIRAALAGWRSAEFTGAQRGALGTASTDALKDPLLSQDWATYQKRLDAINQAQQDLGAQQDGFQITARNAAKTVFSHAGAPLRWQTSVAGALAGAILGIIPTVITLLTSSPPTDGGSYPILGFFGSTAWTLLTWVGAGWFIGYFLPLIRGNSGPGKGMWLFIVWAAASVPDALVWNDAGDWISTLVWDLENVVVLVLTVVIIGDLQALKKAGFRPTDWIRVYNWRFVATWTAALAAAIGTIAIAVVTATITDLSQQQFSKSATPPSSSSNSQSSSNSSGGH